MPRFAIGIDLGCTNIKCVLIDEEGNIQDVAKADTHELQDSHWKKAVTDMILEFSKGNQVDAIGLSAPGLADAENQCIAFMPGRLPGLEHFLWSEWIRKRVWVLNDAHAAMMAEATFGVARGLQHAVLFTLGSGVGGGILINGQLYQGVSQMAGHLGHTTINADDVKQDVTNMPGSIEDAIGNITLAERSQGKYHSTEELVRDYIKGDSFATGIWLTSVKRLAVTIASCINILSPQMVILSGGMVQAGDSLMIPLVRFLEHFEWRPGGKQTPIEFAHFSDNAGAVGAAGFALSKTKKTLL